jgi:hypothetical protein
VEQVGAVNHLARLTGSNPVPLHKVQTVQNSFVNSNPPVLGTLQLKETGSFFDSKCKVTVSGSSHLALAVLGWLQDRRRAPLT